MKDIFGVQQGTVYVKGLLDAVDVHEFDGKLSLNGIVLRSHFTHTKIRAFMIAWPLRNEVTVMKLECDRMLDWDVLLSIIPSTGMKV